LSQTDAMADGQASIRAGLPPAELVQAAPVQRGCLAFRALGNLQNRVLNCFQMDDFNEATASILAKLYEALPQRLSFKVTSLVEGADENKLRNYGDTILFLEREGFIRYESRVTNESFKGVSLTSKGLTVLNSTLDSPRQTLS
jgi:hypothetical protein